MDTALPQKCRFILDRNCAKAKCTENRVCTSCDTVLLGGSIYTSPPLPAPLPPVYHSTLSVLSTLIYYSSCPVKSTPLSLFLIQTQEGFCFLPLQVSAVTFCLYSKGVPLHHEGVPLQHEGVPLQHFFHSIVRCENAFN